MTSPNMLAAINSPYVQAQLDKIERIEDATPERLAAAFLAGLAADTAMCQRMWEALGERGRWEVRGTATDEAMQRVIDSLTDAVYAEVR